MSRLQRMSIAEYWRVYCTRQFCENHLAWHSAYQSEIITVSQASISQKLFRIEFSDNSTTICAWHDTVYVQRIPGTLRNF